MAPNKRTVLITGCSEGGIGAALAFAFHAAGLHVIATARNPATMKSVGAAEIETLQLDVTSLDMLVNNAGAGYSAPFSDLDIKQAKELFNLNVWAQVAITQDALPLLLKSSQPIIVNHTSSASIIPVPFQSVYNASKAAFASLTDAFRLEIEAFGVKVVELKTGIVRTNFSNNVIESTKPSLRAGSTYEPAREKVDKILAAEAFNGNGTSPDVWAKGVVKDVLKANPPKQVYRGESAWYAQIIPMLAFGMLDGVLKKTVGVDVVDQMLRKEKRV